MDKVKQQQNVFKPTQPVFNFKLLLKMHLIIALENMRTLPDAYSSWIEYAQHQLSGIDVKPISFKNNPKPLIATKICMIQPLTLDKQK